MREGLYRLTFASFLIKIFMTKNIFILISILLGGMLAGCSSHTFGSDELDQQGDKAQVYVTFNVNGGLSYGGVRGALRAQPNHPSIYEDLTEREDYVQNLFVYVFDSSTGSLVTKYMGDDEGGTTQYKIKSFVLSMKPGTYDFYFLGNVNQEALIEGGSIKNRDEADRFLRKLYPFKAYHGGSEETNFAMARVYKNQVVAKGGSMVQPKPFDITLTHGHQLAPISKYGQEFKGNPKPKAVNLVRANAKFNINIKEEGLPLTSKGEPDPHYSSIVSVEIINVPTHVTYGEVSAYEADKIKTLELFAVNENNDPQVEKIQAYKTNSWRLCMPERLFSDIEKKSIGWVKNETKDDAIGKVVYLQIVMKSGKTYKIPMITNTGVTADNFFEIARDNKRANYDVVRNHHYTYNITVPKDDKELEVQYQVIPWTLVESEMSYARPKYEFSIKVVKIINGNVVEERPYSEIGEVIVPPDCYVDISFKITEPRGTMWVATISNGLDFELKGDFKDVVASEIVGSNPTKVYKMEIWPKAKFYKKAKFTQFFITVEGRELDLGVKTGETGKYLGEGSTKRWNIKQVMQ